MNTSTPLARVRPCAHSRYRQLKVLGRLLDDLVSWAIDSGYTTHSIYLLLDAIRHLEGWLRRRRICRIDELTEDDLAAAYRDLHSRRKDPRYAWPLHSLARFLRARRLLKPGRPVAKTVTQREVDRWLDHLRQARGLAPTTIDSRRRHATQFLDFVGLERDRNAIRRLSLDVVEAFLCRAARRVGRKTMQQVVGSVRGFLRFQFLRGVIRRPLHTQLDSVRMFRQEQLPLPIRWSHLRELLGKIDQSTSLGRRDYAVLLLAATYGLRASDIAGLTLDEIDWRARVIRIVQRKTRQPLTLPLTDEVGTAIANYVRHARPSPTSLREVFLRRVAPIAPLSLPGVANTLRRATSAAGVMLPSAGFRCLRHALAMRLLRRGASLKAIGDMLGHRSPQSTSQYLRLDVDDLRRVALPVPAEARVTHDSSVPLPPAFSSLGPSQVMSIHRPKRGARMAPRGWTPQSPLADALQRYVEMQRSLGLAFRSQSQTLWGLDFFLARHYPGIRRLDRTSFAAWARGLRSLGPTTARMRMLCVRRFCVHLARVDPSTYVPDPAQFPREAPHLVPHLVTGRHVARALAMACKIRRTPANPLHGWTYRLAFLLMYCCGMRVGETLRLRLADVDVDRMTLRINESKFYKSRLVPLAPSLGRELSRYLHARRRARMPMEASAPLFWNGYLSRRDALTPTPVWTMWTRLCRAAGVLDQRGRPPRLHDLRHSFAVEVLRRAYHAGQEPRVVLPRLSRYMGHAEMQYTHYYLKFTEPLRRAAGDRLRQHVAWAVLPTTTVTHQHDDKRNGGGR